MLTQRCSCLIPTAVPKRSGPGGSERATAGFAPANACACYDVLRDAPQPVATRELTERIMQVKAIPATDDRRRELIQKTICGSLARTKETIERVETSGVVQWRLI